MESFAKIKRRTTDLLQSIPQNMPTMPNMPAMPNMPTMPTVPTVQGISFPSLPRMPTFGSGAKPKPGTQGTWQHIDIPSLPRSSHSIDVIGGTAYLFGGEVGPGRDIDNNMHVLKLPYSGAPADYYAVAPRVSSKIQLAEPVAEPSFDSEEVNAATAPAAEPLDEVSLTSPPPTKIEQEKPEATADKGKAKETAEVPAARIGHASAVIGTRIFVFGGRPSGSAPAPLDEGGRVWIFETKTQTWSHLDPSQGSPAPAPRSGHAAAATDKPRDFTIRSVRRTESWKEWAEGDSADVGIPQRPIAGHVAATAADEEDAGFGTLFVHAGVLADGTLARDLWAFDVRSRIWKELPPAPGPGRSGVAMTLAKGRLYRFGGFDGTTEVDTSLDILHLAVDEFDDRVSKGEVGVYARGDWQSLTQPPAPPVVGGEGEAEQGNLIPAVSWPAARSGASLELVIAGGGREYLILMMGEQAPPPSATTDESAGIAGAVRVLGDVWAFQIPPQGMTTASFTDAMYQAVGWRTGEGQWTKLDMAGYDDEVEEDAQGPLARGSVASAPVTDVDDAGILVFGGVGGSGRRLGDGYLFRFGPAEKEY